MSPRKSNKIKFQQYGVFDPELHKYTWKGKPARSVTGILAEWVRFSWCGSFYYLNTYADKDPANIIPEHVMQEAAVDGQHIHLCAKYLLNGQGLKQDSIAEKYKTPIETLQNFIYFAKLKVVAVEQPMYTEKYDYATTPDIVATMRGVKELCVIEIKTTNDCLSVGPQTMAQTEPIKEFLKYRKHIKRFELRIPKKGLPNYVLTPLLDDLKDWKRFLRRL